tara:strand:- start:1905 stop:2081 length:177 start_codon:yes stop_codon:yes gene_type:complete
MQVIEGWAIFNNQDWCVDYDNIYPTKEKALKAAKDYFCYRHEDEWYGDEVVKVTIKVH